MKKDLNKKREKEKQIVDTMITLYCHKNHHVKDGLCDNCRKLRDYAWDRSDKCPFMENKTFCSNCKVHCYNKEMREEIKKVMRFSGPRMLFYHPITAIYHLYVTLKEKSRQ